MHSSYSFIAVVLATSRGVTAHKLLEPRFFEPVSWPSHGPEPATITSTSSRTEPSISSAAPDPVSAFPSGSVACLPPIQTFVLADVTISQGSWDDHAAPANQTAQGTANSTHSRLETFEVNFLNPTRTTEEIGCHLTWDTSAASPDKYPIAKQMTCDINQENQLNAVLEKQASGIAAGFYLLVWNNNQMETMVAWMVPDIKIAEGVGGSNGWVNGTVGTREQISYEGAAVELNSMPTMLLNDWLRLTANTTA